MSSDGALTPVHHQPGTDLSALKTLVEVSLGLSTLASGSAHSREGTPAAAAPGATRFDPGLSVVVIGMRGVGKVRPPSFLPARVRVLTESMQTTLGIIIATYLSRPFIDADRVFERVFGSSIAALVQAHGWAYFREREAHVLQQLLRAKGRGQVIVLGGGVVETASNRELLREHTRNGGVVMHVSRPMEDVFQYLLRQGTKSTWAAFEEEGRVSASASTGCGCVARADADQSGAGDQFGTAGWRGTSRARTCRSSRSRGRARRARRRRSRSSTSSRPSSGSSARPSASRPRSSRSASWAALRRSC